MTKSNDPLSLSRIPDNILEYKSYHIFVVLRFPLCRNKSKGLYIGCYIVSSEVREMGVEKIGVSEETLKQVVGFCRITPSDCGLVFWGVYLTHIRHCVISDRSVLVLEELPQHCTMLQGNSLEMVCRLLRDEIPVVAQVEEGETRTGLHWVKLEGSYDTLSLEQIAPRGLIANPDVQWTEDTPYGKVIYCASGYPVKIAYDGQTDVNGIPIIKTVFRSTLEKLVEQGKATKKEYYHEVEYTITDKEIAKKVEEQVICKHNVPKHILANTIVIPL